MVKAILASLTGFPSDQTVMETSFALAKPHGAHIAALHTRIDAMEAAAVDKLAIPGSRATLQEIGGAIAREEQERSQAAERVFTESCQRHAPDPTGRKGPGGAAYREITSLFNETLHQSRVNDVTVVARVPELAAGRLDGLIMSSGKPVLVAPPLSPKAVGRNVLIAWKDTAEAARAVTAALPLLRKAQTVQVLTIFERKSEQEAQRLSAEGVVALLQRHGVGARLRTATASAISAADVLKENAYGMDCDLVVMGAYGHSRLWEVMLGGVTRALVADCDVAVMMVH